jgi:hypothetical protein
MRNYITKSKMFGYQIGLLNDNLYVAVPLKYLELGEVKVTCEDESKIVSMKDEVIRLTHDDKFEAGMTYTLIYILWKEFPKED